MDNLGASNSASTWAPLVSRTALALAAMLMLASLAMLLGCSPSWPTYEVTETDYDHVSAFDLCGADAPDELASAAVASASELRRKALTRLRARGARASGAATVITRTLPVARGSVPYRVVWALYEGREALFVVEAIGPAGGTLTDKRLWVLSASGDVLLSGMR